MWLAFNILLDCRFNGGLDDLRGVFNTREEAWEAAGLKSAESGVYFSQLLEIRETDGKRELYSEEYEVDGRYFKASAKLIGAFLSVDGGNYWEQIPGPYTVGDLFEIPKK